MAEERITEVETPSGDTHTTHTIVTDGDTRSGGGGSGWLIAIVLLIAVVAGIWFFSGMSHSEANKDNAIANAADNVGAAAKQAGNAVENAADNVTHNK